MDSNYGQYGYSEPIYGENDRPISIDYVLTPDTLNAFISQIGLKMNASELEYCINYFRSREHRNPTLNEISLAAELIKNRYIKADALCAASLKSDDPTVEKTVRDLYQKAKYLRYNTASLSLKDCADITVKYIETLTANRHGAYNGSGSFIIPPSLTLMLILPDSDEANADYEARVNMLYGKITQYDSKCPMLTVNEYGLLATIAEHTDGVFSDMSAYPNSGTYNGFDQLLYKYAGRKLICTSAYMQRWLTDAARDLSLSVWNVGNSSATKRLFFSRRDARPFSAESDFVRSLTNSRSIKDLTLFRDTTEEYTAPCLDAELKTLDNGAQTLATCTSNLSSDAFRTPIEVCRTVLTKLLCTGVKRRDTSFKCELTLPQSITNAKDASDAFLSVLGTYRFFIELCVDVEIKISFCGNKKLFSCSAIAKTPKNAVWDSMPELAIIPRSTDGLPDFAALRELCACVESKQKHKK